MSDMKKSFFARYLDPGSILEEMLFGLIMVLTFTLGAGLTVTGGPGAVRTLLVAAIGCNIAWGIIDGAMYVMSNLLDRGRRNRMLLSLQSVGNEAAAMTAIGRELDARLAGITTEEERTVLYRGIYAIASRTQPNRPRITREDIMGAVASGSLVTFTALPAAVPFIFMDNPFLAVRLFNLILIGMLFFCGFFWAQFTGVNRWYAGFVMMLVGLGLVGIAMLLGG